MTRKRALDLFCCAGGASMGLHRAGFDVTGIDIRPQPRYPFRFIQADAMHPPVRLDDFDLIWASPPCQAFSQITPKRLKGNHPDLIDPVRRMLEAAGVPYIIENVPTAPLRWCVELSGPMFGLRLLRRRRFESSHLLLAPTAYYERGTVKREEWPTLAGHGRKKRIDTMANWSAAAGIDWMKRDELAQSIPPAYSEHLARQIPC